MAQLLHMDQNQLREVIYKEIMEFHQPRTPTLSFSACLRPAPKTEDSPDACNVPLNTSLPPSFTDFQNFMSALNQSPTQNGEKTDETLSVFLLISFHVLCLSHIFLIYIHILSFPYIPCFHRSGIYIHFSIIDYIVEMDWLDVYILFSNK